jgi:uncharacterized protein (TIRG00374 family)
MRKNLSVLIRITISFGLLGLLFWLMRDNIRDIWLTLSTSNASFLAIALGFFLVNVTMLAYRMKIIFLGENLNITLRESVELTFVGYFFNNFMPTAVGGDIVKAHYAAHVNGERMRSYASVLMDRFIGLYTYLVIAAVALIVDQGRFQLAAVRSLIFVLMLLGIAGFIIATNKAVARFMERFFMRLKMFRLGERLSAIYSIVHDYRNRRDVLVKSFLMSVIAQCLYFGIVYIFFLSLGAEVSLRNIFLIMPVVTFVSMAPSIGGLGVREGAFVAFFATLTGKETAFAASLLLLFGFLFISVIGGIIYFWWGVTGVKRKKTQ